jgi:hypothetical protein
VIVMSCPAASQGPALELWNLKEKKGHQCSGLRHAPAAAKVASDMGSRTAEGGRNF